jgi:predicted site-specific integrase-resolvase
MKELNNAETPGDTDDRLLKKHELTKRLGISRRTLDAWQRQGRIVHFKIGRTCRYRWSDVIRKLQDSFRVN